MNIDLLSKKLAIVWLDCIFSDERERIHNPMIDEEKHHVLLKTIKECKLYSEKHKFIFKYEDPEFPKNTHMLTLIMPTADEEVEIGKEDMELFRIVSLADSVIMDSDLRGNIRIDLFFEDIYKERT